MNNTIQGFQMLKNSRFLYFLPNPKSEKEACIATKEKKKESVEKCKISQNTIQLEVKFLSSRASRAGAILLVLAMLGP